MARPKSPWTKAHVRLRPLYEERVAKTGVTQEEFAKRWKLGTGSMLGQLLSGSKPMSIEAAVKLAKGMRCSIYDFCPDMGEYLETEVFPVLGKALRRAAMVLLAIGFFQLAPSDAYARAALHNDFYAQFANKMKVIHIVRLWLVGLLRKAFGFVSGCALTHTFQALRTI